MAYILRQKGHTYIYQLDFGEEALVARIIVRSDSAGAGGLFLVKPDGSLEPADDRPGFGVNPLRKDGIWPRPPMEAISDARTIAEQKSLSARHP